VSIDQSKLGQHIQEQMEAIEQDPGIPEGAEIGGIVTIVEINDPAQGFANMRVRANLPPYYAVGLLEAAKVVQLNMGAGG
jgi:hypothetical protein